MGEATTYGCPLGLLVFGVVMFGWMFVVAYFFGGKNEYPLS